MDNKNIILVSLKSISIVMILTMISIWIVILYNELHIIVGNGEIVHRLISYVLPQILAIIGIIGILTENLFLTHIFLMKMAIVWFINHHKFKPQIWIKCDPIYVASYIIDFIVIILMALYSYKLNNRLTIKNYL